MIDQLKARGTRSPTLAVSVFLARLQFRTAAQTKPAGSTLLRNAEVTSRPSSFDLQRAHAGTGDFDERIASSKPCPEGPDRTERSSRCPALPVANPRQRIVGRHSYHCFPPRAEKIKAWSTATKGILPLRRQFVGRSLVRDGAGAERAAWLRAGSAEQPHRLDNLGAMQDTLHRNRSPQPGSAQGGTPALTAGPHALRWRGPSADWLEHAGQGPRCAPLSEPAVPLRAHCARPSTTPCTAIGILLGTATPRPRGDRAESGRDHAD